MSLAPRFETLTLSESQRTAFLARVHSQVSPEDYRWIAGRSHALPELLALIEQGPMTLSKLRHLLFGPKTETTDRVCPAPAQPPASGSDLPKSPHRGHGRTGARAYRGARWIDVPHPTLQAGQRCQHCQRGTLRAQKAPALALRIVGAPPISATGYAMARLRCDTCGEVFTAPTPAQAGTQKYDPSVGVTVALLRYGCGMPHYRLARLQKSLGELQRWMQDQLDGHQVEPHSGLGQAIRYMLRRWQPLTLFLRQPGAPLDNNLSYAACRIMPPAGLCRVADYAAWRTGTARFRPELEDLVIADAA